MKWKMFVNGEYMKILKAVAVTYLKVAMLFFWVVTPCGVANRY
jgi:hypothetical protein